MADGKKPDSIVSIDRAYIDYKWQNSLDEKRVWFVTRTKSNIDYVVTGQHPVSGKGGPEKPNNPSTRALYKELLSQRTSDDRVL
jgi:hypothetical protein